VVFINGGDPHSAGDQHIASFSGVAAFVNALARRKELELNLRGQDGGFVGIQAGKKRHLLQDFRVTRHRKPPPRD